MRTPAKNVETTCEASAAMRLLAAPMRYSRFYPWFVLLASLDIMVTWVVLTMGGQEVNSVAAWALGMGGLFGLIGLKFASVVVVVLICEAIGPRNEQAGRRLAFGSIAISAIPLFVAAYEIATTIAIMNAHPNIQF
jgi:Domain of unknown function (DUF5658)